tara:strand:- start:86 stop:520 length:435 start_codon:yes stop_codon:yes gene_type:complete
MHKKTLILGIILGLAFAVAGVYVWETYLNKSEKNQAQIAQQGSDQKAPVFTQPAPEGDIDSGDGLTSIQMFEELQKVTDPEEFNRKYITYMTLLRNNESGMSRLVEEKSNRQELKTAAAQSIEADKTFINNMVLWQRLWGYTDH